MIFKFGLFQMQSSGPWLEIEESEKSLNIGTTTRNHKSTLSEDLNPLNIFK